jgi:large subunit ribosomal protein L5
MAQAAAPAKYQARLKREYFDEFVPQLQKDLKLKNVFEVPRLEKIVLNCGLGRAKDDKRLIEAASNTLRKITGQQPVETIAKQSISKPITRSMPELCSKNSVCLLKGAVKWQRNQY